MANKLFLLALFLPLVGCGSGDDKGSEPQPKVVNVTSGLVDAELRVDSAVITEEPLTITHSGKLIIGD